MRRASTCLAVLGLTVFGLAALGLPAVASAEVPTPKISKFRAKAVPIPKPGGGTYKETGNIFGAGAAIEVEYEFEGTGYGPSAGNPAGGIPPLSGVNFYLPKGTILHTAGFATCTKEKLEKEGAKGCPTKSQASPLGAALGEVYFGSERVPEEATLQGFFAPGGNLLFFTKYHSGAVNPSAPLGAPAAVEIVSPGHFVASSGLYSKEFIGEVPKVETVKGAPLASVKLIKVETGAAFMKGKELVSYGTIPLTCPKGGFPLKTEVTFGGEYGGEREFGLPAKTVTAEYKAPCPTKKLKKKK
jgi:hypothetical protein